MFNRNKLKYSVNEQFFGEWNPQMAYVLGFSYADGNIYKTSLSWDIQKRDIDLLHKINKAMNSNYPIKEQRKSSFRLRINNQILIRGAIKKGLLLKKNIRNVLPVIPEGLIRHFIRGYLEGDGWITKKFGKNEFDVGFVSGNKKFLVALDRTICGKFKVIGKVRTKVKTTPNGVKSTTFLLEYYSSNAAIIANWLYNNLKDTDIYLDRKYNKYLELKTLYDLLWSKYGNKKFIERKFGKDMKEILTYFYREKELNGMQIAKKLSTSKSSVYRWLVETGVRNYE